MKNKIMEKYNLKKLIDKDYLKEFYVSKIKYDNKRLFSYTYYLLNYKGIFPFHKMKSSASWQYCIGNPINLHIIEGKDKIKTIRIGPNISENEEIVYIVEQNTWFAAESLDGTFDFSFLSHHISPSYLESEEDFGTYDKIVKEIPNFKSFAKKFSCKKEKYFLNEKEYFVS